MRKSVVFLIVVVVAMAVLSIPTLTVTSQITTNGIYDMHAIASPLEGSREIEGDINNITKGIPVEYIITISGSPSYNVIVRENLEVIVDLTNPNTIDAATLRTIRDYAIIRWNYNIQQGHILFQPYV